MLSIWRNRFQQSYKINRFRTWAYGLMHPCADPRIAFIFGCQRSGTTLLRNFIGLDRRIRDVGEGDWPYFNQHGGKYLRLIDDERLDALVRSQRSPWVLLKPLHDSQQAARLLKRFERSRGIWIYRHYLPVIESHLRYYEHDAVEYLAPLSELDKSSWMLQGLGQETLAEVQQMMNLADGRPHDMYAVFWHVRNAHLFAQLKDLELLVLSYEDLVLQPARCLKLLSIHLGLDLPEASSAVPHQSSLRSGSATSLDPVIRAACDQMHDRLGALATLNQQRLV